MGLPAFVFWGCRFSRHESSLFKSLESRYCIVPEFMKRDEFIFSIGYQGSAAMVDLEASKRFGKYSTEELAREGLYRAAFCSALYSGEDQELEAFKRVFEPASGYGNVSVEQLKRLFGVRGVPENVTKVVYV